MARGWESKSVEAQQAEADDKSSPTRKNKKMSAEEAVLFRQKESLRLARQRVLQQLEASPNPRHRKLMEEALAHLDKELGG